MRDGRTILVTGAAGLIGRRVVDVLLAQGRNVLATDRPGCEPQPNPLFEVALADAAGLVRLVDRGVGAIIHCGAVSGPMLGRDDPTGTIATNVMGTVTLLDALRRRGGGRFVYCSSVSAYGATPEGVSPVPASAPLSASDTYGASKAAADILVRAYSHDHGVDAVALRIGWVYGPRRRTRSLLHRLIRDALEGRPSVMEHDGAFRIPLIYVDDVARGLVAALDAPVLPERAYNLTSGARLRMRDLAAAVERHLPTARISFTPGVPYPDVEQAVFDIEATCRALDWSPRVSLEAGVAGYIDWLRVHPF